MILAETYDEDLPRAVVEVLKSWVTTFLPPPGLVLAECRKQCHKRMLKLDYDRRLDDEEGQADGMARLTRLKDIIKGHV